MKTHLYSYNIHVYMQSTRDPHAACVLSPVLLVGVCITISTLGILYVPIQHLCVCIAGQLMYIYCCCANYEMLKCFERLLVIIILFLFINVALILTIFLHPDSAMRSVREKAAVKSQPNCNIHMGSGCHTIWKQDEQH